MTDAQTGGFLGVLMLQTRFPRLPGDVGHPATFTMPVRRRIVAGATPQRVVRDADAALLAPFVAAGLELVAQGAVAITTSCGFLARWQRELQAALPVPVWTSSLLVLPQLSPPGQPRYPLRAGVITVDVAALDEAVLRGAGADPATPVQGLDPASALVHTLLDDREDLDVAAAEATVLAAAAALLRREPGLRALVLECTNLPPFAGALRRATGLPVHHLPSLVEARWTALGLRR
jgi:hypothetical protein